MKESDIPRCPVCGEEYPKYQVYDALTKVPIGCENCLLIKKEGRIQ